MTRFGWKELLAAVAVLVAGLAGGATAAVDTGAGCMTTGNGPTVLEAFCSYFAPDDSQNVFYATQQPWIIFVNRCCLKTDPSSCSPIIRSDGKPPSAEDVQC